MVEVITPKSVSEVDHAKLYSPVGEVIFAVIEPLPLHVGSTVVNERPGLGSTVTVKLITIGQEAII